MNGSVIFMKKIKLKVNYNEYIIIIDELVEFRNKLIKDNEDTYYIDKLLLKLANKR